MSAGARSRHPAQPARCRAARWRRTPGYRLLTFLPPPEQLLEPGAPLGIALHGQRRLEIVEGARMVAGQLSIKRATGQRTTIAGDRRRPAGLAGERLCA